MAGPVSWPDGEFRASESVAVSGRPLAGPEGTGDQGSRQARSAEVAAELPLRFSEASARWLCRHTICASLQHPAVDLLQDVSMKVSKIMPWR